MTLLAVTFRVLSVGLLVSSAVYGQSQASEQSRIQVEIQAAADKGPRFTGDSDEADRHSELIAITVPGWIRSVVGAKRRWRMDFAESDRDRQACCC